MSIQTDNQMRADKRFSKDLRKQYIKRRIKEIEKQLPKDVHEVLPGTYMDILKLQQELKLLKEER